MHDPIPPIGFPLAVDHRADGSNGKAIGVRDIALFLRASFPLIAACAGSFAVAALVYTLQIPPMFTATAKVIIDPSKAITFLQDSGSTEAAIDHARIDSQVEIIKSDSISTKVIDDLALLDAPDFARPDRPLYSKLLDRLRGDTANAAAPSAETEEKPGVRYAVAAFANRLSVRRVGQSFVLEIAFRSSNPRQAARIANAVAQAYIDGGIQAKSEAARRGSEWLKQRLDDLRERAYEALRAVERFKAVGDAGPISESHVRLAELQSISETYRRIYEIFLQHYTETAQRISYPVADARIVNSAAVPFVRSHPRTKLIVVFATLFGAGVGTAASLMRYTPDRRLRSPRQIPAEVGAECLGVIGRFRRANESRWRPRVGKARPRGSDDLRLVAEHSSLAADLRAVKTGINAATLGRGPRCIGIVSVDRGEGKTTTAGNLALLYAISGARTLLVDACMANPTASRKLAPDAEFGLLQTFDDPDLVPRLIVQQPVPDLFLLPLGKKTSLATPGDRIGSGKAALQLEVLRQSFDTTIFDLPALADASDARAIAPFLDGVLIVAESGVTSLDQIAEAVASLRRGRANVLGVVVSKAAPRVRRTWIG